MGLSWAWALCPSASLNWRSWALIPHGLGFHSCEMGATLQRHVGQMFVLVVEIDVILGVGLGFCGR